MFTWTGRLHPAPTLWAATFKERDTKELQAYADRGQLTQEQTDNDFNLRELTNEFTQAERKLAAARETWSGMSADCSSLLRTNVCSFGLPEMGDLQLPATSPNG